MKHLLVVFSNAKLGAEQEYNEWYNDRHLSDLLQVAGVRAARRFKLSSAQLDPHPFVWAPYLALYEIETDNLPGVLREIKARSGTESMVIADALDLSTVRAAVFSDITLQNQDFY